MELVTSGTLGIAKSLAHLGASYESLGEDRVAGKDDVQILQSGAERTEAHL